MRFGYKYHDSAGQVGTGICEAMDRDAVYAQLRMNGIRPMQVWLLEEAPPSGTVPPVAKRRYGKRVLAAVAAGAALLAAVLAWGVARRIQGRSDAASSVRVVVSRPRHPLPAGAPVALVSARPHFVHVAEAWLVRYAQPGVLVKDDAKEPEGLADDLLESLGDDIVAAADESPAVLDAKRVVAGLKSEVALMLHSGRSVEDVLDWLSSRQRMEADFRETMRTRVLTGRLARPVANAQLRALGLREL